MIIHQIPTDESLRGQIITIGAIIVLTDGGVLDSTSSVDFSYGCSPNVHYGGAYFVISDGAFGVDWYIGNSYGR